MPATLFIEKPEAFSFRHTICSHGWYDLAPFEMDRENFRLTYVFPQGSGRKPVAATICEDDGHIRIDLPRKPADEASMISGVRHILRLDDDIERFYKTIEGHERLDW